MKNLKTNQPKKRSFIRYGYLTVGILSFIVGIIFCNLINDFNAHYSLRTPIVFQSIIVRRASNIGQVASPSASLAPTPQPTVAPDLQGQPKPDRLKPVTSNIVDKMKAAVVKVFGVQHWDAMNNIIIHESNYNPGAVNPNGGACGLGQFLPCSKLTNKCPDMNVDCQIDAIMDYVSNRYGNPTIAWNFKQVNGWY